MSIIVYANRLSQPSRAVEILLRELGARYTWREVDFANNETHEPWYAERINTFETIPALEIRPDADTSPFALAESHAIMRYLCRTADDRTTAASWYPGDTDAARAARIDQWLDWHHNHIRRFDMFHQIMNLHATLPMLKREIQATRLKPLQSRLTPGLATLDRQLARRAAQASPVAALCGDSHSIADLAIACELYQLVAVGYRFDPFPNLQRWLDALGGRAHFCAVSEQIMQQGRTIRESSARYLALESAFV